MELADGRTRDPARGDDALALVARASDVLSRSLDWDTTLGAVIDVVLPALGDFGFFDVVAPGGAVRRVARAFRDPAREALLAGTTWQRNERKDKNLCALSSGQPGLHPDVDDAWLRDVAVAPAHLELMRALSFRSMITVPLHYGDRLLGALTLFFSTASRRHAEADLALATEVARRAAAAVENARLYREQVEARRRVEALAALLDRAARVRDEFLSAASHELKTPLTSLELQLSSLRREAELGRVEALSPEALRERVGRAEAQVNRLARLVDDLLDAGRLGAGRVVLEPERFDLAALAREVASRFADHAARQEAPIDVSASGDTSGVWDRSRVDQVLTNLLSNAVKYGAGAPVRVAVEGQEASVAVRVADRGIGIAPEDHRRIFERFERAVSSRSYGGMGLGLWLARTLVHAHGGALRVESAPGQGATFTLELPRLGRPEA